jgi:hypothetical protein
VSSADFLGGVMAAWLAATGLLIGYRLLVGQISLGGILTVEGETFSPSRLQLLIVTVSGLAAYAAASLNAHAMVPLQNELIAAFAVSHAFYLGPKAYRAFFSNSK